MPRKRECPPAGTEGQETTGQVDVDQHILYRRQDGYAAPTAQERHEERLLAELAELGYLVAVRCIACNRPLTAKASVARHQGPSCTARAGESR